MSTFYDYHANNTDDNKRLDIALIAEHAHVSHNIARLAYAYNNGDIVNAILGIDLVISMESIKNQ